ncbi:MAG: 3-dehydroquinate synthase, partial [Acidobacteriota bacterium]|nr:3-dehydroquinate synthase [Acidobacteriota bacterium]
MNRIIVKTGQQEYPVIVGRGLEAGLGEELKALAGFEPRKLIVFSNRRVFGLHGDSLVRTLSTAGFECHVWQIPDGEEHKSLQCLENSIEFFSQAGLTRNDAVVAFGGGVTGDIAGFASAIYMRGIPIVQIPTTLLAMVDSSVGGKTAINTDFGKNMIGAFHHPRAVFADVGYLKTLDLREIRAGFYELIKLAAIGGSELLGLTARFLDKYPPAEFAGYFSLDSFESDLIELITSQIEQKARVVRGDQYEEPLRSDSGSRKILNF